MSHNDLLRIQNLKVCAGEKEILHGIDLDIHENEVHVLMGPNGTGKSTLGAALMGNPADLNVGFSGGEKKKTEILQMLMLNPEFVILDETDSGLDVDAVRTVSKGIEAYRKQSRGSLLVITHSTKILEALPVDYTHIMVNGKIVKTSDSSLIEEVNENGFAAYENAE